MSLLKLKSLWYPIGTPAPLNSLQDYFISLYSEQRQCTETLLSLFIRCSVPGVVLIVSIPDICILPYFLYSHEYRLTRNTVYCTILSDQIVVGCPLGVPISYYQSPLILTELFQHNIINVSYLTACYLYQVMMTLHFLNDVANDTESAQK